MQTILHSGGQLDRLFSSPILSQRKSIGNIVQQGTSGKGRKREELDENSDPSKRERYSKSDESDAKSVEGHSMNSNNISDLPDKHGNLSNLIIGDQLVNLTHHDQDAEIAMPIDITLWQMKLANLKVAIYREDCLNQFVQLGGLFLLDEWLQEAHRGKSGDFTSLSEVDKESENLLLDLLCVLEKLPIYLVTLKTVSIWKSVDSLHDHKNLEIQRQARKLVDIWKKQVNAEIKQLGQSKFGSDLSLPLKEKRDQLRPSFLDGESTSDGCIKNSRVFGNILKVSLNSTGSTRSISNVHLEHVETRKASSSASATDIVWFKENQIRDSFSDAVYGICTNSNHSVVEGPVLQNEQINSACLSRMDNYKRGSSYSKLAISERQFHHKSCKGSAEVVQIQCPNKVAIEDLDMIKNASVNKPGITMLDSEDLLMWKDASVNKPGNTVLDSGKRFFKRYFFKSASNSDELINIMPSSMHDGVDEPMLDLSTSYSRSSLNTFDKHACSDVDDAGDITSSHLKQTSFSDNREDARICREMEQYSCPLENGDAIHDNKNQVEAGCHFLKVGGNNLDNYHIDTERVKQSEALATLSVPFSGSILESTCDPILEPATAGVGLLPSVEANEISSNHEMASAALSGSSSKLVEHTVGEEGETGSLQLAVCVKDKIGDSLHTADTSGIVQKEIGKQQLKHPQCTLPSFSEMEMKHQNKADEKRTVLEGPLMEIQWEEGDDKLENLTILSLCTNVTKALPVESHLRVDSSVAPSIVSLINRPRKKEPLLPEFQTCTSIVEACRSDDDDAMNKEGKDTGIVDAAQCIAKEREIASRKFNTSFKITEENAIEVAMHVPRKVEQGLENHSKMSHKENSFCMDLVHNHKDTVTNEAAESALASKDSLELSDGLECHRMLDFSITLKETAESASGIGNPLKSSEALEHQMLDFPVMLSQQMMGYRNLNKKLPKMMGESLDGKKADQITGNFKQMAVDAEDNTFYDEGQSCFCDQQQEDVYLSLSNVTFLSHQVSEAVDVNAKPSIINCNLKIEEATSGNNVPQMFKRLDFDLNKGFVEEAPLQDAFPSFVFISSKPVSVTATKGPFIFPASFLQNKGETGWKGSSATSAFHQAETFRIHERHGSSSESSVSDVSSGINLKQSKAHSHIDLNIVDEKFLEDAGRVVQFSPGINVHDRLLPSDSSFCSTKLEDISGSCKSVAHSQNPKWPILDLNCVHESEDGESVLGSISEVSEDVLVQVDGNRNPLQRCRNSIMAFDLNGGLSSNDVNHPAPPLQQASSSANLAHSVSESEIFGDNRSIGSCPEQARKTYSALDKFPAFASSRAESLYPVVNASASCVDVFKSGTSFSSSTIDHSNLQQNSCPYGGYSLESNASSLSSVSAQPMGSLMPPLSKAVPSQVLASASVKSLHARSSYARFSGGVRTRGKMDLNANNVHEAGEVREVSICGRHLRLGVGGEARRPHHHMIELLGGPVGGESLKKRKEVEGATWGLQERAMLPMFDSSSRHDYKY